MLFLRWRRSHPFRHVRSTFLKIRGTLCVSISFFISQLHQIYLHVTLRFIIQNKSQNISSDFFTQPHTRTGVHVHVHCITRTCTSPGLIHAMPLHFCACSCTALRSIYSEFRIQQAFSLGPADLVIMSRLYMSNFLSPLNDQFLQKDKCPGCVCHATTLLPFCYMARKSYAEEECTANSQ